MSDRGASIRIPLQVSKDGKGYLEDRRPNANMDPVRRGPADGRHGLQRDVSHDVGEPMGADLDRTVMSAPIGCATGDVPAPSTD